MGKENFVHMYIYCHSWSHDPYFVLLRLSESKIALLLKTFSCALQIHLSLTNSNLTVALYKQGYEKFQMFLHYFV